MKCRFYTKYVLIHHTQRLVNLVLVNLLLQTKCEQVVSYVHMCVCVCERERDRALPYIMSPNDQRSPGNLSLSVLTSHITLNIIVESVPGRLR